MTLLPFEWQVATSVLAQADKGFDLLTFLRNVINGLTFGSIYALVALGIVLIYKSSDVVNFGHGQMAMFAAFICFALFNALLPARSGREPLPDTVTLGTFLLALLGTLIFAGAMGLVIERGLLRPLQRAPVLSQVMVTIGLGVLLYGVASLIWKADLKKFPQADFVSGPPLFSLGSGTGAIPVSREVATALGIGVVVSLALFLFFKFTLLGTGIRAMAQNPTAARLMGVNVGLLTGLTWMLAIMLAAVAGILAAPKISLSPNMMDDVAVKAFAAAVLGGITSLPGAIVGGLLIGIISNLVDFYLPGFSEMASFIIIVAILTIRPNGLLGKVVRKKV